MIDRPRDANILDGVRIAHLIETAGPGGAERMIAELAREQRLRGAIPTVFLPDGRETWLEAQLVGADVGVEHFHLASPLSPQCVRTLAAGFAQRGITIAHSHDFTMAVNGACAARAVGIPHIITMHGGRYYAERFRRRLALRLAALSSQAVVAVSDALAIHLCHDLRLARTRVVTIPNGVRRHPATLSPLHAELGLGAEVKILLAVGNLYPVKGHRVLLDALPTLPTHVHVAIAGRGGEEASLRARAKELGVASRLHLLGLRDDIPGLLLAADVFVQPSLDEGLPLAVLEAMFAGCPIVATDVGDVGRAVGGDDAAILVPPGDSQALGTAIGQLIAEPTRAQALGLRARVLADEGYSLATMVDRYSALYVALRPGGRDVTAWMPSPSPSAAVQRSNLVNTSANTDAG